MVRLSVFACAVSLSIASLVPSAQASTVLALELEELVRGSDHVVGATAVSEEVLRDERGRIVTDVTIRIDVHVKGPEAEGETLVVRTFGGQIDGIAMRVPGASRLPIGDRFLLFLRDREDRCQTVGMSQGALRITEAPEGTVVEPGAMGLRLVERQGNALVPGAAAIVQPVQLDVILEQLRALVAEGATASQTL